MMKLVVFTCLLAVAFATPYAPGLAYSAFPYAYGASYAYGAPFGYAAPLLNANWLQARNYRGPLSLAPGQPAEVLGADGRPLDTLDVNLDRAAHLTAKAVDSGLHLLKKRSVLAPVVAAPLAAPLAAPIATSLITPATPITYSAPIAAAAIGYGPTYTRLI